MSGITATAPLVLVVDADAAARARAEALLEMTELGVITCASGEAAVEVLQRCGDDVIMLLTADALLGGMDGHRLAAAAGTLRPGIRVVVSTRTPEACRARMPQAAVCTGRPWLPLDILVQAHAALREPRRAAA
jgi:CheY-like chemotaxis protein